MPILKQMFIAVMLRLGQAKGAVIGQAFLSRIYLQPAQENILANLIAQATVHEDDLEIIAQIVGGLG